MSNAGIVDISTGVASSIGRYFSVISVVPSSLYVVFVYLLVASGSWVHPPDWNHALTSLNQLGTIGLLAFASIALGVFIHPIQFATVQFFEGYWGTRSLPQAIRYRRIIHYQQLCAAHNMDVKSATDQLADWKKAHFGSFASRAPLRSRHDEASRIRGAFPENLDEVMPTRLGNVLRRAESQVGKQYGLDALQVVPYLLLIAPAGHVDYVNDQRSQLDLAVRMTFVSAIAAVTAIVFLWPDGYWALLALVPYALAYLSYRGSVVAAGHYAAALDALVNLDRFELYRQLHLRLPDSTDDEQVTNGQMSNLFNQIPETIVYEHLPPQTEPGQGQAERTPTGP